MNDDLPPDTRERVLAEFLLERERRGPEALDDFVLRYPEYEADIRALDAGDQHLRSSLADSTPRMPERLGDFVVGGKIGHGGMGEIYKAYDERLERDVALKTVRQGSISPEMRERFLREQKILAQLHQTHIVPIYEAGEVDGLQYFVMPLIKGVSLHGIVQALADGSASDTEIHPFSLAKLVEKAFAKTAKETVVPGVVLPSNLTDLPTAEFERTLAEPLSDTTGAESSPTRLSPAYFRSVATVMADAADAVHHAHGAGILHRDLKPGNILLDTDEHCWIIDFGLGALLNETSSEGQVSAQAAPSARPIVSDVMGTPPYMAPEQFERKADFRTDVYGLGVTLYEMLTFRRPYQGTKRDEVQDRVSKPSAWTSLTTRGMSALEEKQTQDREPEHLGLSGKNVPGDLAAICRKAMSKAPASRYQTAGEMADDLKRWLRGEPTRARGAVVVRRVWLWSLRNKGWAAAVAAGVLAVLAVLIGGGVYLNVEAKRVEEAEGRAHDLQFASLLTPIEQIRLGRHEDGWSKRAWDLVEDAARQRVTEGLRAQAVATLEGMDATEERVFEGEQASSVAFDSTGRRLLLGGLDDTPARLWDGSALLRSKYHGPGPVAFAADGTPLQLVVDPKHADRLLLWDVSGQKLVQSFRLPPDKERPVLRMTHEGTFVAASSAGRLLVWETRGGAEIANLPARASALALAPDGSHVAAGEEDGRTRVWALPSKALVATLPGRHRISSLAFQRDPRRSGKADEPTHWLLAAGDTGSGLVIWDVTLQIPRTRFVGAEHDVLALAFNPDGTILASSFIGEVRLWDVATGQSLLKIGPTHQTPGLAFSRDGGRLAFAGDRFFDTRVLKLENGRGQRSLRGLDGTISVFALSADGAYLAALSHTWQVGIWRFASGELLHVLEVQPGWFADNAGMAFGPENRFAFVSGRHATLWELGTNEAVVRRSWPLPWGLVDRVAYPSLDRLILWRMEPTEEKGKTWGLWQENPRWLRARNLMGPNPLELTAKVPDFNVRTYDGQITPDGQLFVASGETGQNRRYAAAFETVGGEKRWGVHTRALSHVEVAMSPAGDLVAIPVEDDFIALKIVAGRTEPDRLKGFLATPSSPSGRRIAIIDLPSPSGTSLRLLERTSPERSFSLLAAPMTSASNCRFDPTGRWFAWGNRDGTVTLCDIDEVFDRLERAGLGSAPK